MTESVAELERFVATDIGQALETAVGASSIDMAQDALRLITRQDAPERAFTEFACDTVGFICAFKMAHIGVKHPWSGARNLPHILGRHMELLSDLWGDISAKEFAAIGEEYGRLAHGLRPEIFYVLHYNWLATMRLHPGITGGVRYEMLRDPVLAGLRSLAASPLTWLNERAEVSVIWAGLRVRLANIFWLERIRPIDAFALDFFQRMHLVED